ncbi:hypothetical protein JCM1840_003167 [Sporobolomyces johnsonii]
MQVHLARVNACFPAIPAGDSLAPHTSLDPLLKLVDVDSRADVLKYRFLGDARRCLLGRMLVRYAGSEANEFIEGIAEQLTSEENAALASLCDESAKLRHALALWTLKEAYTKATGVGLLFDLQRVGFELGFRPTLPSDSDARVDETTIGRGALDGRGLAGWTFRLVELAEDDGTYWLAVALQDPKGDGAVKLCRSRTGRPHWAKVVAMEEIEQAARRAPS